MEYFSGPQAKTCGLLFWYNILMKRMLLIALIVVGCSQAPVLRDGDVIRVDIITPESWDPALTPTVQFKAFRTRGPSERFLTGPEGLYLGEMSLAVTYQGDEPFDSRTKVYQFKADC